MLADGYAKKLAINGFSIKEGMAALKPYLPRSAQRQLLGIAIGQHLQLLDPPFGDGVVGLLEQTLKVANGQAVQVGQ